MIAEFGKLQDSDDFAFLVHCSKKQSQFVWNFRHTRLLYHGTMDEYVSVLLDAAGGEAEDTFLIKICITRNFWVGHVCLMFRLIRINQPHYSDS